MPVDGGHQGQEGGDTGAGVCVVWGGADSAPGFLQNPNFPPMYLDLLQAAARPRVLASPTARVCTAVQSHLGPLLRAPLGHRRGRSFIRESHSHQRLQICMLSPKEKI